VRGGAPTLRQTCPRQSLGRKVRSKLRWFTEFCNSHYVSHFAAFFIDTGAKISVVESCLLVRVACIFHTKTITTTTKLQKGVSKTYVWSALPTTATSLSLSKGKKEADRRNVCVTSDCMPCSAVPCNIHTYMHNKPTQHNTNRQTINHAGHKQKQTTSSRCVFDRFNDPSAGSPTETLLRLLLPLGGRV